MLSGKGCEFRVFYVILIGDAIYIVHAKIKKKNEIDRKTIELIQTRIRSLGL